MHLVKTLQLAIFILLLDCSLILLSGCSTSSKQQRLDLEKKIKNHQAIKISFWRKYQAKKLEEKIYRPPKKLIEYLHLSNQRDHFDERPVAIKLTGRKLENVKNALREIPVVIKQKINDKLIGIFFVNDLGGSGFAEVVFDDKRHPVKGFMVFDAKVLLEKKANQWASWKESSPFRKTKGCQIEAVVEHKKDNNPQNAFQYIFLHEAGHVITIDTNIHPSWFTDLKPDKKIDDYPFMNVSWKSYHKKRYHSNYDDIFPERKKVRYYYWEKSHYDCHKAKYLYDKLEKTDFVTLYATQDPYEDFAESFVTYVHLIMMKKPFKINIREKGKIIKHFNLCWDEARCQQKRKILEMFLHN